MSEAGLRLGQFSDFADGGVVPSSRDAKRLFVKSAKSAAAPRVITNLRTVLVAFVGGFDRWSRTFVTNVRVTLAPAMGPPPIQASAYTMGAEVSSKCVSGGGSLGLSGMNAPQNCALVAKGMNAPIRNAA